MLSCLWTVNVVAARVVLTLLLLSEPSPTPTGSILVSSTHLPPETPADKRELEELEAMMRAAERDEEWGDAGAAAWLQAFMGCNWGGALSWACWYATAGCLP
jgi:hypothetical protein